MKFICGKDDCPHCEEKCRIEHRLTSNCTVLLDSIEDIDHKATCVTETPKWWEIECPV